MQITPQGLLKTLVGVAIAALIITILWYFSSVVVYILVSAVLAVMGRPLVRYIERLHIRQWKVPRTLAAIVTLLFIWVVAAAFAMLFVPLVFDKLNELVNLDLNAVMATIEEPIHRLQEHLAELFAMPAQQLSLSEALISFVREWINFESLNVLLQSTVGLMFSTVVTLFSISFITFFFLKEDGLFYAMVKAMFPERLQMNVPPIGFASGSFDIGFDNVSFCIQQTVQNLCCTAGQIGGNQIIIFHGCIHCFPEKDFAFRIVNDGFFYRLFQLNSIIRCGYNLIIFRLGQH